MSSYADHQRMVTLEHRVATLESRVAEAERQGELQRHQIEALRAAPRMPDAAFTGTPARSEDEAQGIDPTPYEQWREKKAARKAAE